MRRVTGVVARGGFAVVTLALAGCASISQPPGGVETKIPPTVIAITPDSGATNVRPQAVRFQFDKVVTNPPPGSAASLDQLFVISPMDGTPKVSWHRDHIDVHPRHGFLPNTAYSITMLPGVTDLQNNPNKSERTIVFSTGPTIPPLGILGRAFDWTAGTPATGAWVQALPIADTNTVFVAPTDSSGQFSLGPLSAGTYIVRGFVDQDHNRAPGRREKWAADTITLSDTRPAIELDLIERDTTPPRIASAQVTDSLTLTIGFDMALDPASPVTLANLRVQRSDSSALTILSIETAEAAKQAREDSVQRADSLRAATAPAKAAADTSLLALAKAAAKGPPAPKPRAAAPSRSLVLHLAPATPLVVGQQYVVTATGIRNLLGRAGSSTRIVTVPKPEPRAPAAPGAPPPNKPTRS